jgi:hypothetical protein
MGHTDVILGDFGSKINTLMFLTYYDYNRIFVKNDKLYTVYEIEDYFFIADSITHPEEYMKLVNKSFEATIDA